MKRIAIMAVTLLSIAALGHGAEMLELTKNYAMSNLRIGYTDHYHHDEKAKVIQLSFAGIAFSQQVQMDPFFTFENGLKETGLYFQVMVNKRFFLMPAVYRNFDADEYGMAINATVLLR